MLVTHVIFLTAQDIYTYTAKHDADIFYLVHFMEFFSPLTWTPYTRNSSLFYERMFVNILLDLNV